MYPKTKSIRNVGIYLTPDNIENLRLRVTVKKLNSLIRIPKFDSIITNEQETNIQEGNDEESRELSWQMKRLSNFEIDSYKLKENCTTELQKTYHQLIKDKSLASEEGTSNQPEPHKIFTYCHKDNFVPANEDRMNRKTNILLGKIEKYNQITQDGADINQSINPADLLEKGRYSNLDDFENMFIMADLNPEIILFTLKYRKRDGLLIVCPDFNDILINPYYIEVDSDSRNMYHYGMRNISKTLNQAEWENRVQDNEIIEKLTKLSLLENSEKFNFHLPPSQKTFFHIFLEIQSAENLEYDNVHVRYNIEIPKFAHLMVNIDEPNPLRGSTHSSMRSKSANIWKFGYCHDLSLSAESEDVICDNIRITFELISIDSWTRERTEGLTAIIVPLQPNILEFTLPCYRIIPNDRKLYDRLERYFIGGRRETTNENVINRYANHTVTTGNLKLKVQVIKQYNSYDTLNRSSSDEGHHREGCDAGGDSRGQDAIDKIIQSYERARMNLEKLQCY